MLKFLKYWLPIILWVGMIFFLSSRPGLKSGLEWPYDFILRKGAHIAEFAILFLLFERALKNYFMPPSLAPLSGVSEGLLFLQKAKKALLWAFVLTILYAISDEYHQTFIVQRVGSPTDVAIDCLGVFIITWWRIRRFS